MQGCAVVGFSRSSYYAGKGRPVPAKSCPEQAQVKTVFTQSGRSYGSRRIQAALQAQGLNMGRYRIRTLMKQQQLKPVWTKRFVTTTDSQHGLAVADNVLARQFNPSKADQAWVCHITYIQTRSGWLYLAAVLDLYSRKIVGYAMSPRMPADLVCTALQLAIQTRQPAAGLVVHSDRGVQYASMQYQDLLKRHGLVCSMSRKANCWDNAVMERFFLSLKMERVWHQDYANHAEAIRDITQYIVVFYNGVRLHSTLGYLSPSQFERRMENLPITVSRNT
jgi:putative transposase